MSSRLGRTLVFIASIGPLVSVTGGSGAWAAASAAKPPAQSGNVVGVSDMSRRGTALGSGIVFSGGKVLTDCHILRGAGRLEIRQGRNRSEASLSYADRKRDLCELKVAHPERFRPATLKLRAPTAVNAGERVYAFGGWDGKLRMSQGKVLKVQSESGDRVVVFSSRLPPYYNGGALLDRNGALIGILTYRERTARQFSLAYPAQYALVRKTPDRSAAAERDVVSAKVAAPQYAAVAETPRSKEATPAAKDAPAVKDTPATKESNAVKESSAVKEAAAPRETTAAREANAPKELNVPSESIAAKESAPARESKETRPAEPAAPAVVAAKPPEQPKPTAAAAMDFKSVAQDYLNRLAEAARGDLKYPEEAKAQGWGGTTSIRFELDPGGELGDSYVDVSSGYATLDVAALLAVRKAVSALSAPEVVKSNGLKGTVSITFTPPPAGAGRKS